jgi:hypothetical protein
MARRIRDYVKWGMAADEIYKLREKILEREERVGGLLKAVIQVNRLHSRTYRSVSYDGGEPTYSIRCVECGHPSPCPTWLALGAAMGEGEAT